MLINNLQLSFQVKLSKRNWEWMGVKRKELVNMILHLSREYGIRKVQEYYKWNYRTYIISRVGVKCKSNPLIGKKFFDKYCKWITNFLPTFEPTYKKIEALFFRKFSGGSLKKSYFEFEVEIAKSARVYCSYLYKLA